MRFVKHNRVFALIAAVMLSLGIVLVPSVTAEAAGTTLTVELHLSGGRVAYVDVAEQQILDVRVAGEAETIRVQWVDPSYVEVTFPGLPTARLQVPSGMSGSDSGSGQGSSDTQRQLPMPNRSNSAQEQIKTLTDQLNDAKANPTTFTINKATVKASDIPTKSTTVILGPKVTKINSKAFAKSKVE